MALDFNAFQMGQQAVGDPVSEMMQRQQAQLQLQAGQQALQAHKEALQRQHSFGQDMQSFLQNPSANGVASLFGKYPEFNKQISDSWNTIDEHQRRSDATQLGSVASLIAKGDYDNAAQIVQTRINADKAAGRDSSSDEHALAMLKSGDPKQQKAVLGLATIEAAGAVGPEKAGEFLKSLGLSQEPISLSNESRLVTPQGQEIVAANPKPDFLVVPGGGKAIPLNAAARAAGGGGDPASSGGAPAIQAGAPGGFEHAVEHVLSNEGGYNPSDMNGAPVNFGINQKANPGVDVKNMTRDEAKQIYHDKYWVPSGAEYLPANMQAPYFDVYIRNPAFAEKALADSGGDPAKFMAESSAYFQNLAQKPSGQPYAKAWAARDQKNTAIATGGASVSPASPTDVPGTVYGNPKPTAHILTSAEVKASGLDPAKVYQRHPDGSVSSVGEAAADESVDGDPNLTGVAYFNTLPKSKQGIVKTIIDGKFPISAKMTSPSVIRLFEDAARVDPTIDAATYQRRVATQRDFASGGKSGQAIISVRTIINHLYNLAQESEKIGGINWKFGNHLANIVKGQASDPELQGYMATLTPLSNELPKFLGGKAPTIPEISQTREDFSPDKGPDARRKQIGTTMELMQGRFQPLVEAYSQGMNRNSDITDLISSITGDKAAAAKLRALQNYAAGGRLEEVKAGHNQDGGWVTLPSGLKIRKIH